MPKKAKEKSPPKSLNSDRLSDGNSTDIPYSNDENSKNSCYNFRHTTKPKQTPKVMGIPLSPNGYASLAETDEAKNTDDIDSEPESDDAKTSSSADEGPEPTEDAPPSNSHSLPPNRAPGNHGTPPPIVLPDQKLNKHEELCKDIKRITEDFHVRYGRQGASIYSK